MGQVRSASARLKAVLDEIEVLRTETTSDLDRVMAELRALADVASIVCVATSQTTSGWAIERFFSDNLPNASRFRTLLRGYLTRTVDAFGWFDPHRPEVEQRNQLVDTQTLVPRDELERSRLYREVLLPMRMHEYRVTRALLCDGDMFLGWFGVFHDAPLLAAQAAVLEAVLPALARRIATERKLESAPLVSAALDAVLEQIASPALVVSSQGRIFEVNSAARVLLATQRAEIAASIVATMANEPAALAFDLTPLASHGAPDHWLAVLRTRSADARVAQAISRVSMRLKLTRRQREVLSRVVLGESNAAIAGALAISERAVEQHVTALFDRAAVESRAALVAYVLVG